MMTVEGATDAEVFETFVKRILAKKLRPGDIVVVDNAGANRTERVREFIRTVGASVLYPPWKLKGLLREFFARTRDALDSAIQRAINLSAHHLLGPSGDWELRRWGLRLIDWHDTAGWFRHCGCKVR